MRTLLSKPLRALVLTPAQTQEELEMPGRQASYERYALMTGVPGSDMRVIDGAQVPAVSQFELYKTPAGRPCAMVSMQADHVLLRILVPLEVEHGREWLSEALAKSSYLVILDIRETGQVTVFEGRLPADPETLRATREAAAMPRMGTRTLGELRATVADLQLLAKSLLLRAPKPVLKGCAVKRSWFALAGQFPMPTSDSAPKEELH